MIRTTLLIIILILSFTSLKAQDKTHTFEDFKKSTLPVAKEILQKQADQIESLIKLSGFGFSFTVGDITKKTQEEFTNPYISIPTDSIRFQTQNYLKELLLSQELYGSYSTLKTDFDNYDFAKICMESNVRKEYNIRFGIMYFKDGTKQVNKDTIVNEHKLFNNGKLLDSLEIIVDYDLPNQPLKVTLSLENPSWMADGQFISLKEISSGKFTVAMNDSLNKRIVQVDPLNKNGKNLYSTGYSSYGFPSVKNLQVLKQLAVICRETINKIDNKVYSNSSKLATDFELQTKSLPAYETGKTVITDYQIKGMAKTINFYIGTGSISTTDKVTLQNSLAAKGTGPLYIAYDTTQQQYGFTDAKGSWKIPPFAPHIKKEVDNFYSVRNNENSSSIYQIDMQHEKAKKYPFTSIDTIGTNLYIVKREINGPTGVIHNDGSFVLPIEYGLIDLNKNVFFVSNSTITYGVNLYGAFDINGKIILPLAPHLIDFENNFFYINISDNTFNNGTRKTVYNIKGMPVLSDQYSAEDNYFRKDSLLLVTDSKQKYFYVNTLGKKAFPIIQYTDLKSFSNGLAAVKGSNGLYGYINISGALVIPCMYRNAYPFTTKYAFVVMPTNKGGKNYFIKKDGTILKEIGEHITDFTYGYNELFRYILNWVEYDEEGNPVKKD